MPQNLNFAFPFVRIEPGGQTHACAPNIMQPFFYESYKSHVTSLLLLPSYSYFNRLTGETAYLLVCLLIEGNKLAAGNENCDLA